MKAIKQHFYEVNLFIMLYKAVLTSQSSYEPLVGGHYIYMLLWCFYDAVQESFNLNVKKKKSHMISVLNIFQFIHVLHVNDYSSDINYTGLKDVNLFILFSAAVVPYSQSSTNFSDLASNSGIILLQVSTEKYQN